MKAEFVATVSHELRTPLAAIYGSAQTIRRTDIELDPEIQDQLLGVIASESDRLGTIVNDLLVAGRLDADRRAARALDAVGDGVVFVDRAGVIRLWNAAAATITGLPETDVLGKKIEDVVHRWHEISALVARSMPFRGRCLTACLV